ncbi:MAG: hypothetical protein HYX75_22285 [Acidobacteria bacterium]|nr:hypothetical protein [Acidobacteriota bacterium]
MEIEVGRKNVAFGWSWLALGLLFGFFLEIKLRDQNWAGNPFELFTWVNHASVAAYSYPRGIWRIAHAHWGVFAIVNILYGMLIDSVNLSPLAKKAGSILCIGGTLLFTGGLFAAGFNESLMVVAMAGFVVVGLAVILQVAGWLSAVR